MERRTVNDLYCSESKETRSHHLSSESSSLLIAQYPLPPPPAPILMNPLEDSNPPVSPPVPPAANLVRSLATSTSALADCNA
jgi:hypothetical protein